MKLLYESILARLIGSVREHLGGIDYTFPWWFVRKVTLYRASTQRFMVTISTFFPDWAVIVCREYADILPFIRTWNMEHIRSSYYIPVNPLQYPSEIVAESMILSITWARQVESRPCKAR